MVSRVIPVEPFDLVIFGGTGDLARTKILPSLYRRFVGGHLPQDMRIIAAGRTGFDDAGYRDHVRPELEARADGRYGDADMLAKFLDRVEYARVDAGEDDGWPDLAARMRKGVIRVYYLSVAPTLFGLLAERLHGHKIAGRGCRVVVEKPFGRDEATAQELNDTLERYFDETQIFRIDHYLGKETVQNLMAVRFGNVLFEPLWNSRFIDHIQITVAETLGIGGRASYYDRAGAMRDMVQNHMMQLLCLIAMEPPSRFGPDEVRDEKLKVIRALEPIAGEDFVRGQYTASDKHASYTEDAQNPDSTTESFVAMKARIANWRWNGTPFYLRTGKRLKARVSEIAVRFKEPPHSIFGADAGGQANELTIRLQPNEGIDLRVTIKEPGPGGMRLIDVPLDMTFADALGEDGKDVPDAYERLIMDVIRGNQTLFMRGDKVEAAWGWVDPIIDTFCTGTGAPEPYPAGGTGPEAAAMLMARDGRTWRELKT